MIPSFVDWSWCAERADELVLADVRWYFDKPGLSAYESGHIPGAVFIDLDRDLAGAAGGVAGRHPLPEPDVFADAMGRAGIDGRKPLVAYDDAGGVIAARLVWMLRVLGHDAALLDGGLQSYPGALETAAPMVEPVAFSACPWPPDVVASIDDVAAFGGVLLDARPRDRFHGLGADVDPRRGHIPGAVSVPCRENLDPSGRLRPRDELRAIFEAAGVDGERAVISYCGSGVTACHNLLALEHAGLGSGKLFPGSWSGWSADPRRPIE
ncbi:sulfurtransferase [Skermania sp. ID1734]|uniref:sulfurtransferase n=1 Tax=Skermania sp. ID1734 TaxID=2597516 RepID=UPI001180BE60|nr:sulfurtransferase [Skermania sp. ID1734]TSE00336.1 sulfurtransferase [Skermania sp. ID1734]